MRFMLSMRFSLFFLHQFSLYFMQFTGIQVLILSERLHSVTSKFDQLRAIRFQDAISKAIPRRKLSRITTPIPTDASKANNLELKEPDVLQPEPLRVQQQLLDDETRALQVIR